MQSRLYCHDNKDFDGKKYQDKLGTAGERDTGRFDALTPENENPGALAGATGARSFGFEVTSTAYRKRAEAATTLCLAIADCDRQDACEILRTTRLRITFGLTFAQAGLLSILAYGEARE